MAVDLTQVANIDAQPGELPATMAAWVIRQEREGEPRRRLPGRGDRGPRAGRLRGHRARHGRRGQLQQRLGGARQARLGLPLPPRRGPPHRRLGRLRHRVEGGPRGHALAARRRGRRALQPGLLRGPRGPRPRSAGRAVAADLGLRDELGLVRAVHQGPGPAAAAQARAPRLGGGGLLRADLLHRLPDAHGSRASCRRATACSSGAPPAAWACSPRSCAARPAPSASASSPRRRRARSSSSSAPRASSTATSSPA